MQIIECTASIIGEDCREYEVRVGEYAGGSIAQPEMVPYCSVRLLPYQNLLFSADLEFLMCFKHLEDGDATHDVPEATINKIKDWAIEHGYNPQEW